MNPKAIYMAVTPDELEIPLDFAETTKELASRWNITNSSLKASISKGQSGEQRGVKFVRVAI